MFNDFYRDKRVLVTGHTGFKGGWLSLWLSQLGAQVYGISLPPSTDPSLHEVIRSDTFATEVNGDIRRLESLARLVEQVRPQIVFHLAAQALVRQSYAEPIATIETNIVGTANVLEAVRQARVGCPVVVVTSDKCYENREWEFAYRENDPLGGHDIYSMSKAAAELIARAWKRSFYDPDAELGPLATARAGNVIGGGDYAVDRIVPDCIRALTQKKPVLVRNPGAVRPWQHVLECLSGYLWLGARLGKEGKHSPLASAFNFGPDHAGRRTVRELVEELLTTWPGEWTDGSDPTSPHEANLLSLAVDKAGRLLGWRPVWDFSTAVRETIEWYRERHALRNEEMADYSRAQIQRYAAAARRANLEWSRD